MKKLAALAMVLLLILTMSSPSFAAGDDGRTIGTKTNTYSGSNNDAAINMAGTDAIPFTKSIVFVNANGSSVYEPNISFNYEVEPASIEESTYTVTDNQTPPVTAYVHPGPAGGVTGTTIAFGVTVGGGETTAVQTNATGVDVERTGELTLDVTKFEKPGVYRYKITETSDPADVTAVGLTAHTNNYDNVRFLDVYIHYVDKDNDSSTPDVLEMYGAVIFKSTTTTPGQDNITTETIKTTGYEPSVASGFKDDDTVDQYTTYDFTVKKTVSGSMADKLHNFPFYVSITNTIKDAKYTYFDDPGTGDGVAEVIPSAAISKGSDTKDSSLKLKDGEYIKFVGVPSNQTTELAVVVKEFNDTYDAYTPSVTATKGIISMVAGTAMDAQTGYDSTTSFNIKTNDIASQIITIDNNLTEISPTGLTLRIAPYALMLVGGIVLLLISRRRKANAEE